MMENQPQYLQPPRYNGKQERSKSRIMKIGWNNSTKVIRAPYGKELPVPMHTPADTVPQSLLKTMDNDSDMDEFFSKNVHRDERGPKAFESANARGIHLHSQVHWNPDNNDNIRVPYPPPPTSIQPQPGFQNAPGSNYTPKRNRDYPKPWRTNNILEEKYRSYWMPTHQANAPSIHSLHAQNENRPVIVRERQEPKQSKRENGKMDKKTKLENLNPPLRRGVRFAGTEPENRNKPPPDVMNVKPPQVVGTKLSLHMKPSGDKRPYIPHAPSRVKTQLMFMDVPRPYPKPWLMEYQQSDEDAEVPPPPPITEEDRNGNLRRMKSQKELFDKQPASSSVKPKPYPPIRKSQIIAAHQEVGVFTFESAVRELKKTPQRPVPVNRENKNHADRSGQKKQDNTPSRNAEINTEETGPTEPTYLQFVSTDIPILKSELSKYFRKAAAAAVNMTPVTDPRPPGIMKNPNANTNPVQNSTAEATERAEIKDNVPVTIPKPKPRRNPNPGGKSGTNSTRPPNMGGPRRLKTAKKTSNTTDDDSDENYKVLLQRVPRPDPPQERFKVAKYIKAKGWEPREEALRYERHRQKMMSRSKSKSKVPRQPRNRQSPAPKTQNRTQEGNNGPTQHSNSNNFKKHPPPPTSGEDSESAPRPRRSKPNPKAGIFDLKKEDIEKVGVIIDENLNTTGSYTIVPNSSGTGFVKLFPDGRQVLMNQMVLLNGAQNNMPDPEPVRSSRYSMQGQPVEFGDPGMDSSNSSAIGQSYTVVSVDFNELPTGTRSVGVGTSSGTEMPASSHHVQLPSPPPTPPVNPDTSFYAYAAADINYDRSPFTCPGFIENQIPIEKQIGDEFSTVFPPPTPYQDEKKKLATQACGEYINNHTHTKTERQNQSGKNSGYEFEGHRSPRSRNNNQESGSNPKKPTGLNISSSRRGNSPAGNRKVLWNSESAFTTSEQSPSYMASNNPNEGFWQYTSNSGPFEPLHAFQQIIQAELSQYSGANSQFPEGSFLPIIANQESQIQNNKGFQFPPQSSILGQYGHGIQQRSYSPPFSMNCGLAQSTQCQSQYLHPHQFLKQTQVPPVQLRHFQNQMNCHPDPNFARSPRQHRVSFKLPTTKISREPSPGEDSSSAHEGARARHEIPKEVYPDEMSGDGDNNTEAESSPSNENSGIGNSAPSTFDNDAVYQMRPIPRHKYTKHPIFQNLELDEFAIKHFLARRPSTAEPRETASPPPPTPASGDSEGMSMCVKLSNESLPWDSTTSCDCDYCKVVRKYRIGISRSLTCLDQINYLQRNVKEMRRIKKPDPPVKFVDHPKGDRVRPAPTFASRKGYGKVPAYITKRKEEIAKEKEVKRQAELEQTINQIKAMEKDAKEKKNYKKMKKMRQCLIKIVEDETSNKKKPAKPQPQKKRAGWKVQAPIQKPTTTNGEDIFFGTYEGSDEEPAATGGNKCEESFFKVPSVEELEKQKEIAAAANENKCEEEDDLCSPLLEDLEEVVEEVEKEKEEEIGADGDLTEEEGKDVNDNECEEEDKEEIDDIFPQIPPVGCYFQQSRLSCRPPGTSPSAPGLWDEFGQFGARRSMSDSTIYTLNHFSFRSGSASSNSSNYSTIPSQSQSIPDDIPAEELQIETDAQNPPEPTEPTEM